MRYYLHLRDGHDIAIDQEGVEFDSLEDLHRAMLRAARDIMAGDVMKGSLDLNLRIDAETQSGQVVHTVPFEEAVVVSPLRSAA